MAEFKVGATYWTRSMCDYDSIYRMTVVSRTGKTLLANVEHEGEKRLKIRNFEGGAEYVMPLGRYFMAPMISADKEGNGPESHHDV